MKAGFIVSADPGLFNRAAEVVKALGGRLGADGDAAQITSPDGVLFTVYEPVGHEYEFREGPFEVTEGVELPDMSRVSGCLIECRSEDYFSALVSAIARTPGSPVLVVDGNGVVWPGEAVDPRRVQL